MLPSNKDIYQYDVKPQRSFIKYCIYISLILYFVFGLTLHSIYSQTLGAAPIRKMSGAPIGDQSIMVYPPGGMNNGQSMAITTPGLQDSFKVHHVIGLPSFIHMYRVDAIPNATCGLPFVISNRYFGVFVPPGVATQYDITYYYGGNPFVTPAIEPFLDIGKRNTNADTLCPAWSSLNATFNTLADSAIKLSMVGRKEFILDHFPDEPLGVQLSYFNAEWLQESQNRSIIQWSTETEFNSHYFIVEKSNNFSEWHFVDQVLANGNTDHPIFYSTVDINAIDEFTYYRLLQYDYNGTSTIYDPYMLKHNKCEEFISVYPNPIFESLYINLFRENSSFINCQLFDMSGKTVFEQGFETRTGYNSFMINPIQLVNGIYLISITEGDQNIFNQKMIVRNN